MGNFIRKADYFVKKRPTICLFILVFVFVLLVGIGMLVSYAYFTANVQGTGKQITISTSNAIVHFTDNNEINETGITPGTSITKTFYITNTASGSLQYKINWEYLINNFTYRNCLKYTITSTGGGGTLSSTQVPDSEDHINILNNITIPGNTTQNYTMTITYEDNGQNQDADKNKSLIGRIEVTDIEGHSIAPQTSTGTYTAPVTSSSTLYGYTMGQLMQRLYPVGSIYTSTSSTDPSELFPGTTWERYGKGKTLVGVDENDTAFDTVNETGGMKDAIIPYHRHELNGQNALAASAGAHTHDVSGSTSTDGAHTHTIAANGISVRSTATTISTAMPDQLTEEFEDGVNYGEHGHAVTGTGQNTESYTISNSGAHYHTIAANQISVSNSSAYTTGNNTNEGAHTHTIPSLTVSTTANTSGEGGKHIHTTGDHKLTAAESGVPAHGHGNTFALSNNTNLVYSTDAVGAARGTMSSSTGDYSYIRKTYNASGTASRKNVGLSGGVSNNTAAAASSAHNHGNTGGATSSTSGSAHTHSIPALSGSTTASTTNSGTAAGGHKHTITSRTLTSNNASTIRIPGSSTTDGSHTHTIAANELTIGVNGSTVDSGHAGWHVHTVTIPQLTSTNNSSITVPDTNSGHSHIVTGTAASAGAHEHTLSGYTTYAGTSGNTTNANLQPYITVYMWKRVS